MSIKRLHARLVIAGIAAEFVDGIVVASKESDAKWREGKVSEKKKRGAEMDKKQRSKKIERHKLQKGLNKSMKKSAERGGEGSRGGKVVGHTRGGKPIYDHAHHDDHSKFSKEDHMDARRAHQEAADKNWKKSDSFHQQSMLGKPSKKKREMYDQAEHHREKAQFHQVQKSHHGKMGGIGHDGMLNHDNHLEDQHGKTKSGKPIYHSAFHPGHHNFTAEDHRDAAKLHKKLSKTASNEQPTHEGLDGPHQGHSQKTNHKNQASYHIKLARKAK